MVNRGRKCKIFIIFVPIIITNMEDLNRTKGILVEKKLMCN